jgi:ABC-2 type transport system ATP-binding protein
VLVTTHNMREAQQCDRLLVMSNGQLKAQGSKANIIGSITAVAVLTNDWAQAFAALSTAGAPVMLAGEHAGGSPNDRGTQAGARTRGGRAPRPARAPPPRQAASFKRRLGRGSAGAARTV